MTRPIVDIVRPRRTVLATFVLLWVMILQYYLFIALFPDGGLGGVRTVFEGVLGILMFPMEYANDSMGPAFEYEWLPAHIGIPLLIAYFYALAVGIGSAYEAARARMPE